MEFTCKESVLTLFPVGEINSYSAPQVEAEIDKIIAKSKFSSIVLDFSAVSYLSSAGLRIVLKLKQRYNAVKIVDASLEVYDVLQMTGFTSMMEVHKKLREVDVTHAEKIGEGFFSIVYRIDKDTIIKVFRQATSIENVERELNLAKQAFVLGIPTAISFDVVKVGELLGVRFEMLDCASLRDVFRDHPERADEFIDKYVSLLKTINSTIDTDPSLPKAKDQWREKVAYCAKYLDKAEAKKLTNMFKQIPDAPTFVHGDCHYKNIMVQGDELLLIDMDTLCTGHPIFELSALYAPYIAFEMDDPGNTERFLGLTAEFTQKMFFKILDLYLGKHDEAAIAKIAALCFAHMVWWNGMNTPDNQVRHEGNLKRLKEALKTLEDFDIGI